VEAKDGRGVRNGVRAGSPVQHSAPCDKQVEKLSAPLHGTEEMVAALKRAHPPGLGSEDLRIPARLRRDAEEFQFKILSIPLSPASPLRPIPKRSMVAGSRTGGCGPIRNVRHIISAV
jgi:hypothetical protein